MVSLGSRYERRKLNEIPKNGDYTDDDDTSSNDSIQNNESRRRKSILLERMESSRQQQRQQIKETKSTMKIAFKMLGFALPPIS